MQIKDGQLFAGIDAEEEDCVHLRARPILRLHHIGQGGQTGVDGCHVAAVAVIDVVCPHYLAHETLKEVVGFVRKLGTANATNGVGTVFGLNCLEALGDVGERFAPLYRFEFAVLAYQRHLKAGFVVDPVEGEAALVTQPGVVDAHVLACDDTAQFMGAAVHSQIAADGTLSADAGCALHLPRTVGEAGDAIGQRADGADVDDVATGLSVHRLAILNVDDRL